MPPRVQPAESHTGLIVSLVIFVLLAIVLGVTTYTGYNGQAQLEKAAKDAGDKYNSEHKAFQQAQLQESLYKLAVGTNDAKDAETVGGLKGQFQTELKTSVGKFQGLSWQEDKNAFSTSFSAELARLRAELAAREEQLAKARSDADQRIASLNADLQAAQAGNKKLKADLDDVEDGYKKLADRRDQEFAKYRQELKDLTDQIARDKKAAQDTADDVDTKFKRLTAMNRDLHKAYDKVAAEVKPVNILDFAKPLGRVVALDQRGDNVYIDLGTSDNVKPRLTFSVFGSGSYRADRSPKATIEVLAALQPHMSRAHVTWIRDRGRSPLLRGDQLYNPAWSPNMKTHIAIAGLLNLTGESDPAVGDSIRDLDQFLQSASRQHIIVDAYEDPRTASRKGEISYSTTIMVRGDAAAFDQNASIVSGTPELERKNKLNGLRSAMLEEARTKGVQIVPARQFLAMIGFQLPRAVRELDYGGSSYGGTNALPADAYQQKQDEDAAGKEKKKPAPKAKPTPKKDADEEGS